MTAVQGVDVFDTLITRAVCDPTSVFRILGERLGQSPDWRIPIEVFADERLRAERDLGVSGRCPSLRDIYSSLQFRLGLDIDAETMARAEEQLEMELSRPVPGAAALVRLLRAGSNCLIFISETFHTAEFIQRLLVRHSLYEHGEAIFVSCEMGASKQSGGLFDAISRVPGYKEATFTHIGDNLELDVRGARAAGWRAILARDVEPTRYERILESHSTLTAGASSLIAGATRIARLSATTDHELSHEHGVLLSAVGPILISYVDWLAAESLRLGLDVLLFVSRDGEILERITQARYPSLVTRYLYGGRWAFRVAAESPETEGDLLLQHLRDLGITKEAHWGVVDLGWKGNCAVRLQSLLGSTDLSNPFLFYFGLVVRPAELSPALVKCFSFSPDTCHLATGRFPGLFPILELACAGTHGQVIGYGRSDDGVVPRLASELNSAALSWGLVSWQRGLLLLAEAVPVPVTEWQRRIAQRGAEECFAALATQPGRVEATVAGAFPFVDDEFTDQTVEVAPKIGIRDLFQFAFRGVHRSHWLQGSKVRSSRCAVFLFRLIGRLRRFL